MPPFPIEEVRAEFPALASGEAYLDNPAGTQVPRPVIAAVAGAMAHAASNVTGLFRASHAAEAIWHRCHDVTSEFLGGTSGREVIIGQSMTMLTFHMSRSISRNWQPGDEIIVTRLDHEGNVAPWIRIAEDRGLTIRWLPFNRDSWQLEPDDLRSLVSPRTRLVALNYSSNLTGAINPIADLVRVAKAAGALVYVDAVQFAPHGKIDVKTIGCDFLACSSYKFFGPHLGVLWGREDLLDKMYAYSVRCAPDKGPGRHELGTPQIELYAGLAAATDYFVWLGERAGYTGTRTEKIAGAYRAATAYEMPLAQHLIFELASIPGLKIHGISRPELISQRVPTVSISHPAHRNGVLAQALADRGINVWSGNNYAFEAVKYLGLDIDDGVLRIGLAHYNTAAEVERAVGALKKLLL